MSEILGKINSCAIIAEEWECFDVGWCPIFLVEYAEWYPTHFLQLCRLEGIRYLWEYVLKNKQSLIYFSVCASIGWIKQISSMSEEGIHIILGPFFKKIQSLKTEQANIADAITESLIDKVLYRLMLNYLMEIFLEFTKEDIFFYVEDLIKRLK